MPAWSGQTRLRCASMQMHVRLLRRTLGFVMGLPGRFHRFYIWASREKGVSELTLVLGLLSVPITLGVLGICALDYYYTRAHLLAPSEHLHRE